MKKKFESHSNKNIINISKDDNNTDKTFNKFKDLQILVKKESSLRSICKLKI